MSIGWTILVILVGWVSLSVLATGFFSALGNLSRIADCLEVMVNLELAREEGKDRVPDYPPEGFRDS